MVRPKCRHRPPHYPADRRWGCGQLHMLMEALLKPEQDDCRGAALKQWAAKLHGRANGLR